MPMTNERLAEIKNELSGYSPVVTMIFRELSDEVLRLQEAISYRESFLRNFLQRAEKAEAATALLCAEICETSEVLLPIEAWETMRKVSAATAVELGAMIRREFNIDAAMKESADV